MNPNDCMRFIYGQGCDGCHNKPSCWPMTTTTAGEYHVTPVGECQHEWTWRSNTTEPGHLYCRRCFQRAGSAI